jgi:hypothetical protein
MKKLSIIVMLFACLSSSSANAQGAGKVSTRDFSFTIEPGTSNYSVRINTRGKIDFSFDHSTGRFSNVRLLDSAGGVFALSPTGPGTNTSSRTNCENPVFFAFANRSISIGICKDTTALVVQVPRKTVYTLFVY